MYKFGGGYSSIHSIMFLTTREGKYNGRKLELTCGVGLGVEKLAWTQDFQYIDRCRNIDLNVCVNMYLYIYSLALSTESVWEMNTIRVQISASPLNGTRAPWRNGQFHGQVRWSTTWAWNTFFVPETKEVLKKWWCHVKKHRSQLKQTPVVAKCGISWALS